MNELTLDELRHLMRVSAGDDENIDLDGDIADTTFDELNYDSLALLELSGRLFQDHGVEVDEDVLTGLGTPRAVLDHVNALKSMAV